MKYYVFFLSVVFSINSLQAQNIADIISKTVAKYEGTETYFDSGKVVQYFSDLPHPFSEAKIFKTAYTKNGMFNFEYYKIGSSNSLYVINQSLDKKVQSWWGITDKLETDKSLEKSLNAQRGVSSLTSTIIPELLFSFNNAYINTFYSMIDPALIANEDINGNQCYKIAGSLKSGGTIKIWIATGDLFIRKIETDNKVKDFRVKTVYQFFPYTLKKINPELFVFKPKRQIEL